MVKHDLVPDAGDNVPGDGDLGLAATADLEVEDSLGAGFGGVLTLLELHWNVTNVADSIHSRDPNTVLSTRRQSSY